ncbi:MAG: pirin family protein [Rhodospirillaceae bacterium]|jgi:quercetin 2,3-dioxygenase|nr:pirin family protein [Rhodospirillaceae bacterium]MBT4590007.1 pirin family protein [Rhodospirillaceae bacterium]MBT7268042.1 pirin family protein [Rhodospirillaceae bacterium]
MIEVRKSEDRGLASLDWLHSQHTFSFADYSDPAQMGFGPLRVINEDQIQPGTGFGTHGHRDMEILSYILEGELEHKDDMGNGSIIRPGEIQRMSAGTGVMHSESNPSADTRNRFFQIWIIPEVGGIEPGYEQNQIPEGARDGKLCLIGSRDGRGDSVTIHQDAELYSSILSPGDAVTYELVEGRGVWVQLASGAIEINGTKLAVGDGAAIVEENSLTITASEKSEFLLFDLGG